MERNSNLNRLLTNLRLKYDKDISLPSFRINKILVEGRLDVAIYYGLIDKSSVEVWSVPFDLKIGKVPNLRDEIISLFASGKLETSFPRYTIFAIRDRDYLPDNTNPRIFLTDTSDLESLLVASGALSHSSLPGINKLQFESVICWAHQLWLVRNEVQKMIQDRNEKLPDYLISSKRNIRDVFCDDRYKTAIKSFIDIEKGLDINKLFNHFTTERGNMLWNDAVEAKKMRENITEALRISGEMNLAKKFTVTPHHLDFSLSSGIWNRIRGHDIFYILFSFFLTDRVVWNPEDTDLTVSDNIDYNQLTKTNLFRCLVDHGLHNRDLAC